MSDWLNVPLDINKFIGFVYKITNLETGEYYIGKKQFWRAIRRPPLKGKKRVRLDKVESDWKKYYGSCNKLLADIERMGEDNFKREMLMYCESKFDLAYAELKEQMECNVLFDPNSYNEIINIRLRRVCKKGDD